MKRTTFIVDVGFGRRVYRHVPTKWLEDLAAAMNEVFNAVDPLPYPWNDPAVLCAATRYPDRWWTYRRFVTVR